jgi:glycosyltransferase involved in cell wall biosynthesis
LEKYFFAQADHVITVTEEIEKMYLNIFGISKKKISVITNGYDPEDLKLITKQKYSYNDKLRIGYMGNFCKRGFPWKEFLTCFSRLIYSLEEKKVKLNIYGEVLTKQVVQYIKKIGLNNYVNYFGNFSHSEAIKMTSENDILLLLLYETDYSIGTATSKLYNYLIMNKPILALSPEEGAVARIIRRTNTGQIISPQNLNGIYNALSQYFKIWMMVKTTEIIPNMDEIKKYDGRILTKKLSKVMDSISNGCNRIGF